MKSSSIRHLNRKISEVMEYDVLSERLKKTLYYGILPKQDRPSLALTTVIMERFKEQDDNTLFLEKLRFEYASEISREACISPCSLVLAVIYLERLTKNNPNYVSSIPSSKLFLVSVMIASKFLNDEGEEDEVFNNEWASCAKIPLTDLNKLEREFLTAIDWALFVDEEDFEKALSDIEYRVARNESLKRGWMTYADLNILAQTELLIDTWELMVSHVINVSVACTAAYLASLVTLVGSALVVSSLPWNTSQFSTGLSVDSSNASTNTHRLAPPSEYGKVSPQTLDDELDPYSETEVLLANLTDFLILGRDTAESSHVRSPCNGPYWRCKPDKMLTFKPPPLINGRQMEENNFTEVRHGQMFELCSRIYTAFQVADVPLTSRTLTSCSAA